MCHLVAKIDIAYLCTKFVDFRFSRTSYIIEAPQFCSGSHDLTTHSLSSVGCDLHIQFLHQIYNPCDRQLRRCIRHCET